MEVVSHYVGKVNKMGPSEEILTSFRIAEDIVPLRGGQHTSVRVGNAVLKPVDDTRHAEWLLDVMFRINPRGYRISKPIRSIDGTFVYKGWACTRYEQGADKRGHIKEKLLAAKMLHRDLSHLNIRDVPHSDNPWSRGHRIAWQIDDLPTQTPQESQELIYHLLRRVSLREEYEVQIVHGDLAGNILFDQVSGPLIIDFSPTIAPVEYAEAILACDCIAWQGSKVSELLLLPDNGTYKEMIVRAVVFRLAVSAIFSQGDRHIFLDEYQAFKPIIEWLT
jgi:uncharacterized protein (TIGR02569 family)